MGSFSHGPRCVARDSRNEAAMNAMHRALVRLAAISCVVVAHAASASAQTTVVVLVDQSTIWMHDFHSPAAVVKAGSILTVVGQYKDWYEVVVPGPMV